MTEWHPREAMGPLRYLRFKFGFWARASTVPNWVERKASTQVQHSIPVGSDEQVYVGDSLLYKVHIKYIGQKVDIEYTYYIKIKNRWNR